VRAASHSGSTSRAFSNSAWKSIRCTGTEPGFFIGAGISETNHAILGDQNGAGLARNPHRTACSCLLSPDMALLPAPVLVLINFKRLRILRALLARGPAFFLLLTGPPASPPRNGPFALCTGVIGEDDLGFVFAKRAGPMAIFSNDQTNPADETSHHSTSCL